jgi:hypothetical protein
MQFINYTPFAGIAWETVNCHSQWFATAMARARFKLIEGDQEGGWHWRLDPEQGDLFAEDLFYDDDMDRSVRYESDYVSFKPAADLIINANTYAPDGEAQTAWTCGVQVYSTDGRCTNRLGLKVQGGKKIIGREAVLQVPIRYEYSAGGILKVENRGKEDESLTLDRYNPVGCGRYFYQGEPERDVQIRYQDKTPQQAPPGFGAIHRSWKSRLDLAGTYDQQWMDGQHPLPPHDFDFYHNQAAHPDLVVQGYFQTGMQIRLENLVKGHPNSYFGIPDYRLMARIHTRHEKRMVRMLMDTLLLDIDSENPQDFRVYASWRAYDRLYGEAQSAEVMLIPTPAAQTQEAA